MKRTITAWCFLLLIFLIACQPVNPSTESTDSQHVESPTVKKEKEEKSFATQMIEEAREGKMIFVDFPIGTPVQKVLKEWGTPEGGDPSLLIYEKSKFCGFYSRDTQQITAIRLVHPQLKNLSLQQIQQELGNPEKKGSEFGDNYVLYQLGNYQISFYYTGDRVNSVYLEKFDNHQ